MKPMIVILFVFAIILLPPIVSAETKYSGEEWILIINEDPAIDPVTGNININHGSSMALGMNSEQQARAMDLANLKTTKAEYYAYVYPDLFAIAPAWLKASWEQEGVVVSPSGTLIQSGFVGIEVEVSDDGRILSGMTEEELRKVDETCPFNTIIGMQGQLQDAGGQPLSRITFLPRSPDLSTSKWDLSERLSSSFVFGDLVKVEVVQPAKASQLLVYSKNTGISPRLSSVVGI